MKEAAKLLCEDQADEMVEDAAVFVLRMFLDQDIVMLKHLTQLRQMFGAVTSVTANKICEVGFSRDVGYFVVGSLLATSRIYKTNKPRFSK